MMATVDLVGVRPVMQATLAALFKFEMFDGVGDEQQTAPARACFICTDHRAKLSSRADAPLRPSRGQKTRHRKLDCLISRKVSKLPNGRTLSRFRPR
jgi:hypothetical protein